MSPTRNAAGMPKVYATGLLVAALIIGACGLPDTDEIPGIQTGDDAKPAASVVGDTDNAKSTKATTVATTGPPETTDPLETNDPPKDDPADNDPSEGTEAAEAPVETVLATAVGAIAGHRLDILELRDTPTGTVMKYRIANEGEKPYYALGAEFMHVDSHPGDHFGQPTAVTLIDETAGIIYEPASDEDGDCVCSIIDPIDPGAQANLSITFAKVDPASTLAVEFPKFGRLDGLKLGDGAQPGATASGEDGALASVEGPDSHRLDILELRDTPSGAVLRYRIVNEGDTQNFALGADFMDNESHPADHFGQPTAVRMVDEKSGVAYRPALDESGDCVCTLLSTIPPNNEGHYAITFGKVADVSGSFSVDFPVYGSIDGLTVSAGQARPADGRGEVEDHQIDVAAVRPTNGGVVVDYTITNNGERPYYAINSMLHEIGAHPSDDSGEPTGVRLIDEVKGLIYRPLLDQAGDCVCTRLDIIDPGQTMSLSITFGGVDPSAALAVDFPAFGYFAGFSLQDSGSPSDAIIAATRTESYAGDAQEITAEGISIRAEGKNVIIDLAGDVLFNFDEATLTPEAAEVLDQLEAELAGAAGPIAVVGHTDSVGTPEYNQDLSERRATTVADEMRDRASLADFTFDVSGKGETEPIADNETEEGRAKNRRVTLTFTKG